MSLGSVSAKNLDLAACYGDSHSSAWPATVYLALFNSDPSVVSDPTTVELTSTGGYVRVALTNSTASFAAPASGSQANAIDFALPASSAAYSASFSYWAYMSDATAGYVLDSGLITGGPFTVTVPGRIVVFVAGTLVVSA